MWEVELFQTKPNLEVFRTVSIFKLIFSLVKPHVIFFFLDILKPFAQLQATMIQFLLMWVFFYPYFGQMLVTQSQDSSFSLFHLSFDADFHTQCFTEPCVNQ